MSSTEIADAADALDLARETIYRFLATVFGDPRTGSWQLATDPVNLAAVGRAAELLRHEFADQRAPLGFGELPVEDFDAKSLLAELARPRDEVIAQYVRVFGLVACRECPPYETEYQKNEDIFFRSQQMADIAGFYRAFGLEPAADSRERPDYLPLELEFQAFLLMKKRLAAAGGTPSDVEHAGVCEAAHASFVREHLSWWVPSFTLAVRRKTDDGVYHAAATMLAALLPLERAVCQVPAPQLPILEPKIDEPSDECEGCALRQGA